MTPPPLERFLKFIRFGGANRPFHVIIAPDVIIWTKPSLTIFLMSMIRLMVMMMFAPALILSQALSGLFQHLLSWTTRPQDVKSGGEKNAAECFSELPARFDHN